MKKIRPLHIAVFLLAEAILVLCFVMLLVSLPSDVFWLDLIVSSLCLGLLVTRAIPPMIDLDDPAQRDVASLGLTWTTTFYYTVTAVVLMILLQLLDISFIYQLLIQIILAFALLLGFLAADRASDKTVEVYNHEQRITAGLDDVRLAMQRLDRAVAVNPGIPPAIRGRVADIQSSLRYLTPSNNPMAAELEQELTEKIRLLTGAFSDYELNAERIPAALNELEHIVMERKSVLSR